MGRVSGRNSRGTDSGMPGAENSSPLEEEGAGNRDTQKRSLLGPRRDAVLSAILPRDGPAFLDVFTENASLWVFPRVAGFVYCPGGALESRAGEQGTTRESPRHVRVLRRRLLSKNPPALWVNPGILCSLVRTAECSSVWSCPLREHEETALSKGLFRDAQQESSTRRRGTKSTSQQTPPTASPPRAPPAPSSLPRLPEPLGLQQKLPGCPGMAEQPKAKLCSDRPASGNQGRTRQGTPRAPNPL